LMEHHQRFSIAMIARDFWELIIIIIITHGYFSSNLAIILFGCGMHLYTQVLVFYRVRLWRASFQTSICISPWPTYDSCPMGVVCLIVFVVRSPTPNAGGLMIIVFDRVGFTASGGDCSLLVLSNEKCNALAYFFWSYWRDNLLV
jgi:hypothetical protein